MYRDFYATVAVLLGLVYGVASVYMQDAVRANILIAACLALRLLAEFFNIHLWKPRK